MVNGKSKVGSMVAYLYVIIPTFIFCVTWLKIPLAIVMGAILIISTIFLYRYAPELPVFQPDIDEIILIVVIVGIWVYLSGIGGLVYQNADHISRNGIFTVLVENDWPVVKEILTEQGMQSRGLTYYIGFWLPAALFGKIFGLTAGFLFQCVWAVLGILIVYYLICCILGKMSVWPLIVFIFFGGLDIFGFFATGNEFVGIKYWQHLEQWTYWQFSSICTQLFWVFNQAISAWVITLMLFLHKDNKNTLFLWSMGMMCCTLPFVGMIPLILCFGVQNQLNVEEIVNIRKFKVFLTFIGKLIKGFITPQNTIGALSVALLMLAYLSGNEAVADNAGGLWTGINSRFQLMGWFTTLFFEVFFYYVVIKKYHKKNPIFYVSLVWLMFCPLLSVGNSADFCMRASIPALLMLYIMVVQTLKNAYQSRDRVCLYLLIGLLCVSAVTGIFEINRTITYTMSYDCAREAESEETVLTKIMYSSDAEENFFMKYLAR